MSRQVILDTETTGLDARNGDRVIEIGCVELVGRKLTGRNFHCYINPEREIDPGAMAVHGITNEFLADKPRFREIADEFVEFVAGAELIIHNAPFDVGFLDCELGLLESGPLSRWCDGVIDTLKMARELHPGKKNSLDALCLRYEIDNSGRQLHGALLDAELLSDVYLAMTRGQESLMMDLDADPVAQHAEQNLTRGPLRVICASETELGEHERVMGEVAKSGGGQSIWAKLGEPQT